MSVANDTTTPSEFAPSEFDIDESTHDAVVSPVCNNNNSSILLWAAPHTVPSSVPMPRRTSPSCMPSYMRFDRPGAVEMEGRAFGAPRRASLNPAVSTDGPAEGIEEWRAAREAESNNDFSAMVEASMVKDMPVVFADTLSFKHFLREGPLRKFALLALLLLLASVAVICSLLFIRPGADKDVVVEELFDGTLPPSMSPTLILEDVRDAAAVISGWSSVQEQGTPQYAAVSWLSTFDQVEIVFGDSFEQRYSLAVLYFSTMGQNYLQREEWLNTTMHECGWSSGILCKRDLTNRLTVYGIDLTRNGASGSLPEELGNLKNLEFIRMSTNQIGGSLPMSICNLKKLETLELGSNMITGLLPEDLDGAFELTTLILSNNNLVGPIPPSLWNAASLRTLDMSSNSLTGSIPSDVQNLAVLVTLDLSFNLLVGPFPPELLALSKLDFIMLE